MGNFALSLQYQQESIDMIYSKLPDAQRLLATCLSTLGGTLCSAGHLKSGMTKLKEAIPFLLKAQNYSTLGEVEHSIAEVCLLMQMNWKALVHSLQALNAFQGAHDVMGQIRCFHLCVMANLAVGDSHAALGAIKSAEKLLRDESAVLDPTSHAMFLHAKGASEAARGNHEDANSFYQGAIMFSQLGDSNVMQETCLLIEGATVCSLGQLELMKANEPGAEKYFVISAATFRRLSQPDLLQSLTYLAQVIDDIAATDLLAAIMPPLMHSDLDGLLADAFLTSADITLRQGNTHLAHNRVQSAMRHLDEVDTVKLHIRANTLLEKCTAPTV